MATQTYSFLDVHMAIAGPGGGFSLRNGTAKEGITIEYAEDKSTMQVGADGSAMHSLKAGKSGRATIRLLKTSPINAQLSALYNFQTNSAATHGQNTITLSDIARGDVITLQSCAFKKFPDNAYAEEGGMLLWAFDAGQIDSLLGFGTPALT